MAPPFRTFRGTRASPVLLAVPHAGRVYPPEVLTRARLTLHRLEALEDRHADLLVTAAVEDGIEAIVVDVARAAIDLNRDEREVDLAGVAGKWDRPTIPSPRISGGLGLVPRRLAREGEIWAYPIQPDELRRWIEGVHRPYHRAIAQGLSHRVADHGIGLLIDCHSMPPLAGSDAPQIVFGTLGGRSVAPRFVRRALDAARAAGLRAAVNAPYAGGHTVDRHGRPALARHALQVEVDRSLYLASDLRTPDASGVRRIQRFLADLVAELEAEASGERWAAAAE